MLTKASKNGLHTEYFENGQEKIEKNYRDGRLHGKWTEWYENGQKASETNYKNRKFLFFNKFFKPFAVRKAKMGFTFFKPNSFKTFVAIIKPISLSFSGVWFARVKVPWF